MAITKGAKKAERASKHKYVFNVRKKVALHDVVQTYKAHIHTKAYKEAQAILPQVYKAIDKAAKRNVITKNTANRKKSRLTAQLPRI
jgi:small subunit ribosomal protein S20